MTFILTELSESGVIMAADSSETVEISGCEYFKECNKIMYFPELNIGISTWGNAKIDNKEINKWLFDIIEEFKKENQDENLKNNCLQRVSEFIAKRLNAVFPNPSDKEVLGLHIAGYSFSNEEEYRPGIFHVHNHREGMIEEIKNCLTPEHREGNPKLFVAEKTQPILPKGEFRHLRNGMYQEFASAFSDLYNTKQKFINTIRSKYHHKVDYTKLDVLKIQAESVANWVRLMCNTFSEAGILPYIGKNVKVLVIREHEHRKFILTEFSEGGW